MVGIAWQQILLLILATLPGWLLPSTTIAQSKQNTAQVLEDQLNPESMRWAGQGLPLNKAANIVDTLTSQPVGRVIIDRNAVTTTAQGGAGIIDLFGSSIPQPGRGMVVSVWGSKIEGCFVEVYLQQAPATGRLDQPAMTPTLLEMGVNGQVIQLPPQRNATPKFASREYTYVGPGNVQYRSIWYGNRTLFAIDANIANILASATAAETRARLTLANGETVLIRLEKTTAEGWKQAYGFNPNCQSPKAVKY
jgi:hypothetical protein